MMSIISETSLIGVHEVKNYIHRSDDLFCLYAVVQIHCVDI